MDLKMPRRRIVKKNNYYELDFIWSKGHNIIDNYCQTETETQNKEKFIIDAINKFDNIIYIKSGFDIETFSNNIHLLNKPKILLTTDGDGGFPSSYNKTIIGKIINNKFITKWYIQNLENNNYEKVKPFPIGLDLHTKGWKIGKTPLDKVNYMLNLNYQKDKKNSILIDCYMTKERHIERKKAIDILENKEHIDTLKKRYDIKSILKLYSDYKFVLSPHGNGLDCHRTWEVLLVGSIPIVKTSSLDILYEDLPVVIVKDWNECLDIKNLEKWYNKYRNLTEKDYIIEKFSYKYWLNK